MCNYDILCIYLFDHADGEAFLEAAKLAAVASALIHRAVALGETHVLGALLDGALEEAFAAFAGAHAVVLARRVVAAHGAQLRRRLAPTDNARRRRRRRRRACSTGTGTARRSLVDDVKSARRRGRRRGRDAAAAAAPLAGVTHDVARRRASFPGRRRLVQIGRLLTSYRNSGFIRLSNYVTTMSTTTRASIL